MIVLGVAVTIIAGILGEAIGASFMNAPNVGVIVAIAVMGGFIMAAIKQQGETRN